MSHAAAPAPPDTDWFDPAPYRAHLKWLIAHTGADARIIAATADIAPTAVHRLLAGSCRRIHRSLASRLMYLGGDDICPPSCSTVPASRYRELIESLGTLGIPDTQLEEWLTIEDRQLLASDTHVWPAATAARVQAGYDQLTGGRRRVEVRCA